MAIKAAKKQTQAEEDTKGQVKLVQSSPSKRREKMGELLVQAQLKQIEREKHLGHAKTVKNEIDELLEQAKQIARETVTGQLRLEIEEVWEESEGEGLEGRVLDQSNIKKPEELRRQPHADDDESEDSDAADED